MTESDRNSRRRAELDRDLAALGKQVGTGPTTWHTYGSRMLHLLEPGERVLAFEDISVIPGWGIPKLTERAPGRHTDQPFAGVLAVVLIPAAVVGWSPSLDFKHGRTGSGAPHSMAAYAAAAIRGALSVRLAVTDRRVLVVGDPRGLSFGAVFSTPDRWDLRFAAPRAVFAAARRQWYWLHWARLRVDFADGSWLKLTTSSVGGRSKVNRLVAALAPEGGSAAGLPPPAG